MEYKTVNQIFAQTGDTKTVHSYETPIKNSKKTKIKPKIKRKTKYLTIIKQNYLTNFGGENSPSSKSNLVKWKNM